MKSAHFFWRFLRAFSIQNLDIYHPTHTYFVDYPPDDPYIAIDGVATKFTFFTADLHLL